MKFKVIKLNFRGFDRVKILLESDPLPIVPIPCPSNIHPLCHGMYVKSSENQVECLLCTYHRKVLTSIVDGVE